MFEYPVVILRPQCTTRMGPATALADDNTGEVNGSEVQRRLLSHWVARGRIVSPMGDRNGQQAQRGTVNLSLQWTGHIGVW